MSQETFKKKTNNKDTKLSYTNSNNNNNINNNNKSIGKPKESLETKLEANLHSAANEGKVELVRLLLRCGADINAQDEQFGNTALHQAAWNGFSETIQVLCKHRANTSIKNKAQFTPLHMACQQGHNQTARLLLMANAKTEAKNSYGDTPLHTAARYGHAGVARILLSAKSNPNQVNKNHDTPLHIAAAMGRRKLTKIFMQHGAEPAIKNKQNETAMDIALRKDLIDIQELIANPPPIKSKQLMANKRAHTSGQQKSNTRQHHHQQQHQILTTSHSPSSLINSHHHHRRRRPKNRFNSQLLFGGEKYSEDRLERGFLIDKSGSKHVRRNRSSHHRQHQHHTQLSSEDEHSSDMEHRLSRLRLQSSTGRALRQSSGQMHKTNQNKGRSDNNEHHRQQSSKGRTTKEQQNDLDDDDDDDQDEYDDEIENFEECCVDGGGGAFGRAKESLIEEPESRAKKLVTSSGRNVFSTSVHSLNNQNLNLNQQEKRIDQPQQQQEGLKQKHYRLRHKTISCANGADLHLLRSQNASKAACCSKDDARLSFSMRTVEADERESKRQIADIAPEAGSGAVEKEEEQMLGKQTKNAQTNKKRKATKTTLTRAEDLVISNKLPANGDHETGQDCLLLPDACDNQNDWAKIMAKGAISVLQTSLCSSPTSSANFNGLKKTATNSDSIEDNNKHEASNKAQTKTTTTTTKETSQPKQQDKRSPSGSVRSSIVSKSRGRLIVRARGRAHNNKSSSATLVKRPNLGTCVGKLSLLRLRNMVLQRRAERNSLALNDKRDAEEEEEEDSISKAEGVADLRSKKDDSNSSQVEKSQQAPSTKTGPTVAVSMGRRQERLEKLANSNKIITQVAPNGTHLFVTRPLAPLGDETQLYAIPKKSKASNKNEENLKKFDQKEEEKKEKKKPNSGVFLNGGPALISEDRKSDSSSLACSSSNSNSKEQEKENLQQQRQPISSSIHGDNNDNNRSPSLTASSSSSAIASSSDECVKSLDTVTKTTTTTCNSNGRKESATDRLRPASAMMFSSTERPAVVGVHGVGEGLDCFYNQVVPTYSVIKKLEKPLPIEIKLNSASAQFRNITKERSDLELSQPCLCSATSTAPPYGGPTNGVHFHGAAVDDNCISQLAKSSELVNEKELHARVNKEEGSGEQQVVADKNGESGSRLRQLLYLESRPTTGKQEAQLRNEQSQLPAAAGGVDINQTVKKSEPTKSTFVACSATPMNASIGGGAYYAYSPVVQSSTDKQQQAKVAGEEKSGNKKQQQQLANDDDNEALNKRYKSKVVVGPSASSVDNNDDGDTNNKNSKVKTKSWLLSKFSLSSSNLNNNNQQQQQQPGAHKESDSVMNQKTTELMTKVNNQPLVSSAGHQEAPERKAELITIKTLSNLEQQQQLEPVNSYKNNDNYKFNPNDDDKNKLIRPKSALSATSADLIAAQKSLAAAAAAKVKHDRMFRMSSLFGPKSKQQVFNHVHMRKKDTNLSSDNEDNDDDNIAASKESVLTVKTSGVSIPFWPTSEAHQSLIVANGRQQQQQQNNNHLNNHSNQQKYILGAQIANLTASTRSGTNSVGMSDSSPSNNGADSDNSIQTTSGSGSATNGSGIMIDKSFKTTINGDVQKQSTLGILSRILLNNKSFYSSSAQKQQENKQNGTSSQLDKESAEQTLKPQSLSSLSAGSGSPLSSSSLSSPAISNQSTNISNNSYQSTCSAGLAPKALDQLGSRSRCPIVLNSTTTTTTTAATDCDNEIANNELPPKLPSKGLLKSRLKNYYHHQEEQNGKGLGGQHEVARCVSVVQQPLNGMDSMNGLPRVSSYTHLSGLASANNNRQPPFFVVPHNVVDKLHVHNDDVEGDRARQLCSFHHAAKASGQQHPMIPLLQHQNPSMPAAYHHHQVNSNNPNFHINNGRASCVSGDPLLSNFKFLATRSNGFGNHYSSHHDLVGNNNPGADSSLLVENGSRNSTQLDLSQAAGTGVNYEYYLEGKQQQQPQYFESSSSSSSSSSNKGQVESYHNNNHSGSSHPAGYHHYNINMKAPFQQEGINNDNSNSSVLTSYSHGDSIYIPPFAVCVRDINNQATAASSERMTTTTTNNQLDHSVHYENKNSLNGEVNSNLIKSRAMETTTTTGAFENGQLANNNNNSHHYYHHNQHYGQLPPTPAVATSLQQRPKSSLDTFLMPSSQAGARISSLNNNYNDIKNGRRLSATTTIYNSHESNHNNPLARYYHHHQERPGYICAQENYIYASDNHFAANYNNQKSQLTVLPTTANDDLFATYHEQSTSFHRQLPTAANSPLKASNVALQQQPPPTPKSRQQQSSLLEGAEQQQQQVAKTTSKAYATKTKVLINATGNQNVPPGDREATDSKQDISSSDSTMSATVLRKSEQIINCGVDLLNNSVTVL